MQWRLDKFVVQEMTSVMRRLFRYNKEWTNKGLEIIEFTEHDEHIAFEHFFHENEKYPVISVGSTGGNFLGTAFNDLIHSRGGDSENLGVRANHAVLIDDEKKLVSRVPDPVAGENVQAMRIFYNWSGEGEGGDRIRCTIYSDYSQNEILTQVILPGTTDRRFHGYYIDFINPIQFTGNDVRLEFDVIPDDPTTDIPNPQVNSSYFVGIDTTVGVSYTYNNEEHTGMVTGVVYTPPYMRIGSRYEGSVVLRAIAKNNTNQAYNIGELMSMYLYMLKHGKISREVLATNGTELGRLQFQDALREFTSKGIYINNISLSPLEQDRRGKDDLIFTRPITVNFTTEWRQDYDAKTIAGIDIKIDRSTQDLGD